MAIDLETYDKSYCPFKRDRADQPPRCQICGKTPVEKAKEGCPLTERAATAKKAEQPAHEALRRAHPQPVEEGEDEDTERDESEGEDRMERGGRKRTAFRGWR